MADVGVQAKIGADASEYNRVVQGMPKTLQKSVSSMESTLTKLRDLFDAAMVARGFQSLLSAFDDIDDAAKRLGMSAEDVQALGGAAKMAGSSLEQVDRVIRTITVSANEAAKKGGEAAAKFQEIGIDPSVFAGSSLVEKMTMLADAQQRVRDGSKEIADFWEVIGAKAGGIDFGAIAENMSKIPTATADTVERLASANDALEKGSMALKVFLGESFAAMTRVAERLEQYVGGKTGLWSGSGEFKTADESISDLGVATTPDKAKSDYIAQTMDDLKKAIQADTEAKLKQMAADREAAKKESNFRLPQSKLPGSVAEATSDELKRIKEGRMATIADIQWELQKESLRSNNEEKIKELTGFLDFQTALANLEQRMSYSSAFDQATEYAKLARSKREAEAIEDAQARANELARADEEAKKEARERYLKDIHGNNIITQSQMSILKTAATSGRFGGDTDFEGMTHGYGDSVARGTNVDLMRSNARIQKMQERVNGYLQRGAYGAAAALTDRMNTASELQVKHMANRLESRINRNQEQIDSGRYSPQEAENRTKKNNELRAALEATRNGKTDTMEKTVGDILAEITKRLPITALG